MLKKLLVVMVFILNINATEVDSVKIKFIEMTNDVEKIVKNKEMESELRNDKIIVTITPSFDFELMARLSLGKVWKTMDKIKQAEFTALYVKRMKKSYSAKIDKYTDEKIVIDSIKQTKKTRIMINSSLVSDEDKLEMIYKYHKPKKSIENKNEWLIYDVVISGVSIIKTDRAQFKSVLKESSIDDLMDKLRT